MTLAPLVSAPVAVLLHVMTVLPAAVLGAALLAGRKGTAWHRRLGRVWLGLMAATALISLLIREGNGPFGLSLIHLLSLLTLVSCWQALSAARRGDIRRHRLNVQILYGAAIVGAGLFTLVPGRRMHAVLFSEPVSPQGLVGLAAFLALFAWLLLRLRRTA